MWPLQEHEVWYRTSRDAWAAAGPATQGFLEEKRLSKERFVRQRVWQRRASAANPMLLVQQLLEEVDGTNSWEFAYYCFLPWSLPLLSPLLPQRPESDIYCVTLSPPSPELKVHWQLIKDQVYDTAASISGWHVHFKLATPFNQRPSCLNTPRKAAKFNTASQHLYKEITYSRACYSSCSTGGEMQAQVECL